MKNSLKSLVAIVAFAGLSAAAYAQVPKILAVDMAKLYDNHYKTVDYNTKLRADAQKVNEEVGRAQQEINQLQAAYEKFLKDNGVAGISREGVIEMDPKFQPPSFASEDKKKKMLEDLREGIVERIRTIQTKDNERQQYAAQNDEAFRKRLQVFRSVMIEDIAKAAVEIAKRKGATLLVDKSGPTFFGIPSVLYVDSSLEITDEVLKELNKDRPATPTPAPASTGAASPTTPAAPAATTPAPASSEAAPKILLPGTPIKK